MTTVIEYVRHAQEPLRADLSPADALALSCLIYVDFHALPGPRSPHGCLLREVAQASSIPSLYRYSLASHADRPLLEAAGDLRGLPRDGCERGRVGGGCPFRP